MKFNISYFNINEFTVEVGTDGNLDLKDIPFIGYSC